MKSTYGRLMFDIDGKSLSIEDKKLISNKHVGGLIFFSKNFESFQQISNLVKEVRVRKLTKLFIWNLSIKPIENDQTH